MIEQGQDTARSEALRTRLVEISMAISRCLTLAEDARRGDGLGPSHAGEPDWAAYEGWLTAAQDYEAEFEHVLGQLRYLEE